MEMESGVKTVDIREELTGKRTTNWTNEMEVRNCWEIFEARKA